jgi:hypothetical protein
MVTRLNLRDNSNNCRHRLRTFHHIVVVHRPRKDNTNADALSRLRSISKTADTIEDSVFGFVSTVIGLSTAVLHALTDGYKSDRHFATIYQSILQTLFMSRGTDVRQ